MPGHPPLPRRLLAEAAGTFVLVFAGTGAMIVDAEQQAGLGTAGVALVFGLAIAAGVFTMGWVSGAHFNPAISLGLASIGRFPARDVPAFVGAQIAGAVAGSLLLRALFGNVIEMGATLPDVALWKAFLLEIVFTGILAFVIARVATTPDVSPIGAALAIGGAVALGSLVAGPLTGASMNPARSFAPALVSLHFADHWLYWTAPPLGALIGMRLYVTAAAPTAS